MTDRERYMRAMRHDFPKDFAEDDPFLLAMEESSDIHARMREKNTAGRMPKSGGDKNMAKNNQQFSDREKIVYYGERFNDKKLSQKQRDYALKRLNSLCNDGKTNKSSSTIKDKCCAESAGFGFGRAKSGQRVVVDVSVQDDFRNGVKRGRSK